MKTHCARGHPYDETNTAVTPKGRRYCRACHREDQRVRYERDYRAPPKPPKPDKGPLRAKA